MNVEAPSKRTTMGVDEAFAENLIDDFDRWFQTFNTAPLVGAERAILKTFCYFLIRERKLLSPPAKEPDHAP